ncbi:hypothetical protein [Catenovulum adriaticum]|uniref:Uncharacterized protein n=1 Tax=Catenovulum adriaticum TaxID=2984846 RepID=A0ABY7APG5_9ALTE|nr:hypothetical protein [Catenovulum sp. TS8]WAJ70204.1 hypothetical protein OLW01_13835 [Catenovulum sp. TS8]
MVPIFALEVDLVCEGYAYNSGLVLLLWASLNKDRAGRSSVGWVEQSESQHFYLICHNVGCASGLPQPTIERKFELRKWQLINLWDSMLIAYPKI